MKAMTATKEEFEFFSFSEEIAAYKTEMAKKANEERAHKDAVLAGLRAKRLALEADTARDAEVPRGAWRARNASIR